MAAVFRWHFQAPFHRHFGPAIGLENADATLRTRDGKMHPQQDLPDAHACDRLYQSPRPNAGSQHPAERRRVPEEIYRIGVVYGLHSADDIRASVTASSQWLHAQLKRERLLQPVHRMGSNPVTYVRSCGQSLFRSMVPSYGPRRPAACRALSSALPNTCQQPRPTAQQTKHAAGSECTAQIPATTDGRRAICQADLVAALLSRSPCSHDQEQGVSGLPYDFA